jgi:hypothetical protein
MTRDVTTASEVDLSDAQTDSVPSQVQPKSAIVIHGRRVTNSACCITHRPALPNCLLTTIHPMPERRKRHSSSECLDEVTFPNLIKLFIEDDQSRAR